MDISNLYDMFNKGKMKSSNEVLIKDKYLVDETRDCLELFYDPDYSFIESLEQQLKKGIILTEKQRKSCKNVIDASNKIVCEEGNE
jgi:hypothetical protein